MYGNLHLTSCRIIYFGANGTNNKSRESILIENSFVLETLKIFTKTSVLN